MKKLIYKTVGLIFAFGFVSGFMLTKSVGISLGVLLALIIYVNRTVKDIEKEFGNGR